MKHIIPTLPKLIWCDDYHDILYLPDDILNYLDIKIKTKELGCTPDGYYVGLVYQGKKPKKAEIAALLKRYKVRFGNKGE